MEKYGLRHVLDIGFVEGQRRTDLPNIIKYQRVQLFDIYYNNIGGGGSSVLKRDNCKGISQVEQNSENSDELSQEECEILGRLISSGSRFRGCVYRSGKIIRDADGFTITPAISSRYCKLVIQAISHHIEKGNIIRDEKGKFFIKHRSGDLYHIDIIEYLIRDCYSKNEWDVKIYYNCDAGYFERCHDEWGLHCYSLVFRSQK